MDKVVIFFVGFALAVILAQKLKINAGFVAIGFGFILTWIFGGENGSSSAFIKAFPVNLFWNYSMPVIFYAFAAANGTLEVLGQKISYKFRNARWALPIAMCIVGAVVAAAGAGTMNTFIVAPLAWGLCMAAGVTPMIVPVSLWCGSFIGSFLPWTSNGALLEGMYTEYLPGVDPMAMAVRVAVYYIILAVVFLVVMYVLTKAWKLDENGSKDFMKKPEPFNKYQIVTLVTIFVCIALLLVPSILKQFIKAPALKWMSSNFSLPVTSVIGISVVAVFGGCQLKKVLAEKVNWNMILLITGMGMYCTLANTLGIVDTLGTAMQNMPAAFVPPCLSLIGSALSLVTSASTVQPLLFSMMPALSGATGLSFAALVVPMMMGVGVTSFSPVSTGGAACLIGAPAEEANKLFNKMLITAICLMIICAILCATPLMRIGA